MQPIPQAPGFDNTLAMLRDPYRFVSSTCRTLGSELFKTRLLLSPTICMSGAAAADLFYRSQRLIRQGAALRRVEKTLVGKGGVQGLDDEAHRHRKQMFLSIITQGRIQQLSTIVRAAWPRHTATWSTARPVVFYDVARELLMRAVCEWAGVPLAESEVAQRTRETAALFDYAGSVGPKHWWARRARARCERWLRGIIADVRRGQLRPTPDSAAHIIAFHRDLAGKELPLQIAAVELLNVIRPTVAVAVFLTQALHALHLHPQWRDRIATIHGVTAAEDRPCLLWFVQEVRRWYPFFPAAIARVREEFVWRDHRFPRHCRVLLDLYGTNRDPRSWRDPDTFDPERFREREDDGVSFIPQGGGDAKVSHRCPGEPLAIELMAATVEHFARTCFLRMPEQDLSLDYTRMPALPRSRLLVTCTL